jgi:hypothetical protein
MSELQPYRIILGPLHGKTLFSAMLPDSPTLTRLNSKCMLNDKLQWITHEKRNEDTVVWIGNQTLVEERT